MRMIAMSAAALALGLLMASAHAQGVGGIGAMGGGFGGHHHKSGQTHKAQAPKPKVDERAYDAALKKLPDKPYDAWHGVR